MRSQRYSASPMMWVENSTARPAARSRRMASTMNWPLTTSSALVGSSRMSRSGSWRNARAMLARCFSPEDSVLQGRSAKDVISSSPISCSMRRLSRASSMPYSRPKYVNASRAVQPLVELRVAGVEADLLFRPPGARRRCRCQRSHRALVGRQNPGDHAQDGGLAGAVGAQQADDFAGADLDRHSGHGADIAEGLGEGLGLERGIHFSVQ